MMRRLLRTVGLATLAVLPARAPASSARAADECPLRSPALDAVGSPCTWGALAAAERWADALEDAERLGFDELCRKLPRQQLLLLGNAAHFGGAATRAVDAFSAVRGRFPGSAEASLASYMLGQVADVHADPVAAAHWFRTYLAEEPAGALAREATGRLIEALLRAGEPEGARQAARRYLELDPGGRHAHLARSLVGS